MKPLAILVPTRGRPHNIERLLNDFEATGTQSTLVLALDSDDPKLSAYHDLTSHPYWRDTRIIINERTHFGMVQAVNHAYSHIAHDFHHFAFLGDDVTPHTPQWDTTTVAHLNTIPAGIVYWNDGYHGAEKPTHWAVTGNITRTFGFFAPPTLTHLYVDDFYQHLSRDLGHAIYLGNVLMEHLHPLYHKSPIDESYQLTNSPAVYVHDHDALTDFLASDTYRAAVLALKQQEGKVND